MEIKYIGVIAIAIIALLIVLFGKKGNNPSSSGSTEQDITDAINAGRKIEAIKHYRFVHNVGLKEAKDAVDEMQKQ